jgi:hypothetical protein
MKVLSWNIRGLNKAFKQKEVKKLVRSLNISILCLVETKIRKEKMDRIVATMVPGWETLHNYSAHCYGRIWICWDPGIVNLEEIDIQEQIITCRVHPSSGKDPRLLSAIYGANQGTDRRKLLLNLELIKRSFGSIPWLLAGDFNFVRRQEEKWGNELLNGYEREFASCLRNIEVDDLPFSGCFHTWSNKQAGNCFVAKKLDRVLVNFEWLQKFGNTSVDFLEGGVSGHSLAMIAIGKFISCGPKPFKFFNFWTEHKSFLDWVREGWNCKAEGYAMFKLYAKLKSVKKILKVKNLEFFGGLGQRVIQAKEELVRSQSSFMASRGDESCRLRMKECLHNYLSISAAEENLMKQKSRVSWLNLGDGNTSYFHKMVKIRNSSNLIKVLKDKDGNKVTDIGKIKDMAIVFYKNLLGGSEHIFSSEKACRVSQSIKKKVFCCSC